MGSKQLGFSLESGELEAQEELRRGRSVIDTVRGLGGHGAGPGRIGPAQGSESLGEVFGGGGQGALGDMCWSGNCNSPALEASRLNRSTADLHLVALV